MKKATHLLLVLALSGVALAALPAPVEGYWNWTRLNVNKILDNATGAHPNPKDVYANLKPEQLADASGKPKLPYPDGTVIVKERFDPQIMAVGRVYYMQKTRGAWSWGVLDRQSNGSYTGGRLGNPALCVNCHTDAKATDWSFTTYQKR